MNLEYYQALYVRNMSELSDSFLFAGEQDQNLTGPITTTEKFLQSDHRILVFGDRKTVITGYSKYGTKNLYLYVSIIEN